MVNPLRSIRHYCGKIITKAHRSYLRSAGVELGTGGFVSPFAQIDVRRGQVVVEDDVTITAGTRILSHSAVENTIHPDREPRSRTVIRENVFIGVNSVVLPGVEIGKNAIVGAGSVVTDDVEADTVVAGNPAEKIKDIE